MRAAWRAVAAVSSAAIVLGAYGAWRWRTKNHWRMAKSRADVAACPESKTLPGDCAICAATECCAEIHACYSSADCIDLNDCMFKCAEGEGPKVPPAECPAACETRHSASIAAYHLWDDCARSRCEEVCPRETEEHEEEERRR